MGPFLALTLGQHFSANAGVVCGLADATMAFQSVADYEVREDFGEILSSEKLNSSSRETPNTKFQLKKIYGRRTKKQNILWELIKPRT